MKRREGLQRREECQRHRALPDEISGFAGCRAVSPPLCRRVSSPKLNRCSLSFSSGQLTLQAATNADFEAQREHRLADLPLASDPPTPEDEAAREVVLAQFYRDWQIGQRVRQEAWVRAWWRDVWDGIKLQGRVHVARWRAGLRG